MKSCFIRLFNYDRYANLQILNTIVAANQPQKSVQIFAHLLAAQQIWYKRCINESHFSIPLWPDWKAETFKDMIEANHVSWLNFIKQQENKAFEQLVTYTNKKGEMFSNQLADLLQHVINHGTHHRAQAGQHLKVTGATLPVTDYIYYVRQMENNN